CLALGLSPFIMQFTESVISVCFNTSLATYGGDIAVGSMTILSSVMQFSMLPLQGLTQGSQPIVSFNYGAGNIARVKKGFRVLLIACLTYSTALWSIAMFAPQVFVGIFSSDAALSAYAIWAMRIYMATSLMFGAQIACQQTFIAIGNAKISVFLALLRKVLLLIPLIMILPHMVPNKVMGVFLAEPIADFLAVCTTCVLFFLSYRKLGQESDPSHRITEI
ncbi:MAG: MATE family efflux transporter, partial [Clostridia bacterium]